MCKEIIAISSRKLCVNNNFYKCIENVIQDEAKYLILREKDLNIWDYGKFANEVIEYMKKSHTEVILNLGITSDKKEIEWLLNYTNCRKIHIPLYVINDNILKIINEMDIVGVSVHSLEEAVKAQNMGVDYLIAGHIFDTQCKKGIKPRGLKFLKSICNAVDIDVYGIGGITPLNEDKVINSGAKGICMMSKYFN